MCSICGIYNTDGSPADEELTLRMSSVMKMRGPDGDGVYTCRNVCMAHNRLAVIDPKGGAQPMRISCFGREYVIVYNGEIYNADELRKKLKALGADFKTECDTEVVLWAYALYKEYSPELLNGIFAYSVYDVTENKMFLCRDRLGVKPLCYAETKRGYAFASESKALLLHPDVTRKVDLVGFWQLLYLSPATVPGMDVFRDIKTLEGGECAVIDRSGFRKWRYWQLEAKECRDSREEAIEKTYALICDAAGRQLVSDVPLCTFLSGGLDSSVLTAIAAREYRKSGRTLETYSFEYENDSHVSRDRLFQPTSDDDFAAWLAGWLGTDHTVLKLSYETVADLLTGAVDARDFPGQADIDSSLLAYCGMVKKRHTVAISGECSDEIFGGYPWFYRQEMLERDFFPWIHDPAARADLFNRELLKADEGYGYMSALYRKTVDSAPVLESDSESMITSRRATVLSTTFFMQHLLCRKDRMSMAASVEVRVPFADHRIIEYVYNLPWEIKFENGVEKALLRNAAAYGELLPDEILKRKKSPYPKTHDPMYEKRVSGLLAEEMKKDGVFTSLIDRKKVCEALGQGSGDVTWYGQLMSRPQLAAWLLQMAYWCESYAVVPVI